jgi:hypothetical protein
MFDIHCIFSVEMLYIHGIFQVRLSFFAYDLLRLTMLKMRFIWKLRQ